MTKPWLPRADDGGVIEGDARVGAAVVSKLGVVAGRPGAGDGAQHGVKPKQLLVAVTAAPTSDDALGEEAGKVGRAGVSMKCVRQPVDDRAHRCAAPLSDTPSHASAGASRAHRVAGADVNSTA